MTKLTNVDLNTLQEVAKCAAMEAGQYIQSQFDQHYVTQRKEGGDSLASQVVTEVDIKAQQIILTHLKSTIDPYELGLLTEESVDDQSRATQDYFWCIDPMDGTLPFTERRTGYAVSIALISKVGDPVVGVVYVPDLAVCYTATKGNGVSLNGQPFIRNQNMSDQTLHFYMDISFRSEEYFELVQSKMEQLVASEDIVSVQHHSSFGGVRNAIGVMSSEKGCYFKFPKNQKGCGSIWDYAATRLFFEELGLIVSDASGGKLHLNKPGTTFLNDTGVLYATDESLSRFIMEMGSELRRH